MKYAVTHTTSHEYSDLVAVCHNRVRLAPRETERQTCLNYQLELCPTPKLVTREVDYFGNLVDYFSIHVAYRQLRVTSSSTVDVKAAPDYDGVESPPWEAIRDQAQYDRSPDGLKIFQLTLPSARVQTAAELCEYAQQSFRERRPIIASMRDLNRRIHHDFAFDQQATTIHTTVAEVFELRRGVCQDFAHLALACLRSIGLPARYVSGYVRTTPPPGQPRLVGADASHAWASVFCGALGWVDMDPTNNLLSSDSHICVGWGRDYDDVCPIQGIFVGGGHHELRVSVDMIPWDERPSARAIQPLGGDDQE